MIRNWEAVERDLEGFHNLETTVEFEPYEQIPLRPNYLLDLLANQKVLHLGCTDHLEIIDHKRSSGQYLHSLLGYVTSKCVGIDINEEAIAHLRRHGIHNILAADITTPGIAAILEDHFDTLLLGEVLEHIDNPVDFLRRIVANYGGHISRYVITVPNAFGLPFLANALNLGREAVNPDHKYWFTPYTLMKVAHQAGLVVEHVQMCLYENSKGLLPANEALFKSKPLLLDTIVAVCRAR